MDDREQRIRDRAYAIWQREGRPEGREREHWQAAAREVEMEVGSAGGVTKPAFPVAGEGGPGAQPAARKKTGAGAKKTAGKEKAGSKEKAAAAIDKAPAVKPKAAASKGAPAADKNKAPRPGKKKTEK